MTINEEQVWHAAFDSIAFFINRPKMPYTTHDVANDVVKRLFGKSFSAIISDQNEIHMTCNFGHKHVLHPYKWRPLYIPTLELLRETGKPITTPQLKRKFPTEPTAAKVLSELAYFGAVKKGLRGYSLTLAGDAFLDGTAPLPEFVYKPGPLPEGTPKAPSRFIHEIGVSSSHSPTNDAA